MADAITAAGVAGPETAAGAASGKAATAAKASTTAAGAAGSKTAAGVASGKAATAAKASTAAAGAVSGMVLTAAKAAVVSPIFGAAAVCGIIAFEWWKGNRDAQKFTSTGKCQPSAS